MIPGVFSCDGAFVCELRFGQTFIVVLRLSSPRNELSTEAKFGLQQATSNLKDFQFLAIQIPICTACCLGLHGLQQGNTRVETIRYPEKYVSILLLVLSKLTRRSRRRVRACVARKLAITLGRVNFVKLISCLVYYIVGINPWLITMVDCCVPD
jgi:hypothetical protein